MTSQKVVNIKTAQRPARQKAPRSMDEIAAKARREYERLKGISESEPENLASGDPARIHEEDDDEA